MNDETLKMIGNPRLPDTAQRDAVHIAVAPVIAGERLHAGDAVAVKDGVARRVHPTIGIVDPFILTRIDEGARVFVFLRPGSITSLRHEWTHPAFDVVPAPVAQSSDIDDRAWLVDFAAEFNLSLDALFDAARKWRALGEYYVCRGHGTPDRAFSDIEEFWTRFERYTGETSSGDRENFFTCSC